MGEVPEIDIEFIPSTETPVGLGEPATTAVARAIGNAIFAATGARVRHLPIGRKLCSWRSRVEVNRSRRPPDRFGG